MSYNTDMELKLFISCCSTKLRNNVCLNINVGAHVSICQGTRAMLQK